jgi:crotonobetainyl-CoA:carnitine CoA-transferase CaiB-like acyl-CoA transferase
MAQTPTPSAPKPAARFEVPALVSAVEESTLSSQMAGKIRQIHVGLGDQFRKGARLLDFDCSEQVAQLEAAAAELRAARETHLARMRLQALGAAGVPCAPVNDVVTALRDPQAEAREGVVEAAHERFGAVRTIATPLRVGDERRVPSRAPRRGEHTRECLTEICGYSAERVSELTRAGVFGDANVAVSA